MNPEDHTARVMVGLILQEMGRQEVGVEDLAHQLNMTPAEIKKVLTASVKGSGVWIGAMVVLAAALGFRFHIESRRREHVDQEATGDAC